MARLATMFRLTHARRRAAIDPFPLNRLLSNRRPAACLTFALRLSPKPIQTRNGRYSNNAIRPQHRANCDVGGILLSKAGFLNLKNRSESRHGEEEGPILLRGLCKIKTFPGGLLVPMAGIMPTLGPLQPLAQIQLSGPPRGNYL